VALERGAAHRLPLVAVTASDLTLGDLLLQTLQATAAACQLGHVPALAAHVVELKDEEALVPAVLTAGLHQQVAHVPHVAPLACCQQWMVVEAAGLEAPRACPTGGPYPVAVGAHDLAVGELPFKTTWRGPLADQVGKIPPRAMDVVKLQNDRFGLSTVRADPGGKVLVDEEPRLRSATPSRSTRLSPVQIAAGAEIVPIAITTPPLAATGMTVEAGERQLLGAPTAAARPGVTGVGADRRHGGRLNEDGRRRPWNITHPPAYGRWGGTDLVTDPPD
jgi:hypothetical protein